MKDDIITDDEKELSNSLSKRGLVKEMLLEIKLKEKLNYKKWKKLKRIKSIVRPLLNGLNTISITSIVISISPLAPIMVFVALGSSSLATLGNVITNSYELEAKIHSYNQTYLQYASLYRDTYATIKRNHLTSEQYDDILSDLNARIGLIADNDTS